MKECIGRIRNKYHLKKKFIGATNLCYFSNQMNPTTDYASSQSAQSARMLTMTIFNIPQLDSLK